MYLENNLLTARTTILNVVCLITTIVCLQAVSFGQSAEPPKPVIIQTEGRVYWDKLVQQRANTNIQTPAIEDDFNLCLKPVGDTPPPEVSACLKVKQMPGKVQASQVARANAARPPVSLSAHTQVTTHLYFLNDPQNKYALTVKASWEKAGAVQATTTLPRCPAPVGVGESCDPNFEMVGTAKDFPGSWIKINGYWYRHVIETITTQAYHGEGSITFDSELWARVLSCSFTAKSSLDSITHRKTQGQLQITASDNLCGWEIKGIPNWLTLKSTTGTGSQAIRFEVDANPNPVKREATLTINNVPIAKITQAANDGKLTRKAADMDGDGIADFALYRGNTWFVMTSTGNWKLKQETDNRPYWSRTFGPGAGIPFTGDFDGDGLLDLGVARTEGTDPQRYFYILPSTGWLPWLNAEKNCRPTWGQTLLQN